MARFNYTKHNEPNWKDINISGKWAPVIIESPYFISYEDTVSMIMRCDGVFTGFGGNDRSWNKLLRDYAGVPEKTPNWISYDYYCNSGLKDLYEQQIISKFEKEWNINTNRDIFNINLFSSAYIDGPYSFVNYKTGKVGLIHNVGKWPDNIGNFAEELEWFANTYPLYPFFITFCDDDRTENPICTLLLYEGKIKRVITRTKKDWNYVKKINHLEGATSKNKMKNKLHKFIWRDTNIWRILIALSIKRNIIRPLSRKFWESDFAKKYLHNIRNEKIIKYNDKRMFDDYENEKYFDRAHAISVIDDWKQILKET